jgi:hypothetical protein
MNFKHYTNVTNYTPIKDGVKRDFFSIMYDYTNADAKDIQSLKGMSDLKLEGISYLNTENIRLGNAKEYISGKERDIRLKAKEMKFVKGGEVFTTPVYYYEENGKRFINWKGTLDYAKKIQKENIDMKFVGFEGDLYVDGKLHQKNFKLMNTVDMRNISKFSQSFGDD